MNKTLRNLVITGGIILGANNCSYDISQEGVDKIFKTLIEEHIDVTRDNIKVYNWIKEEKYDSAELYLKDILQNSRDNYVEAKGIFSFNEKITPKTKEEITAKLDSSINELDKCLK